MRWLHIPFFALLVACLPDIPEIAKGLSLNVEDGTRILDQSVKAQFPVGSDEQKLLVELSRQGFKRKLLDGYYGVRSTTYARGDAMRTYWAVHWLERRGKITEVRCVYGSGYPFS